MKKIIIPIIVTIVVIAVAVTAVLLLGGNDELPENDDPNEVETPEKLVRGTKTTTDNPLFGVLQKYLSEEYTFNEDGTCSSTRYWWIENETESSLEIYISDEYKILRSYYIDRESAYSNFASIIVSDAYYEFDNTLFWMSGGGFSIDCFELNPKYTQIMDIICNEWESATQTAVFYEDGTCVIDGEECSWRFRSIYSESDYYTNGDGFTDLACVRIIKPENIYHDTYLSINEKGYYTFYNMYLADAFEKVELTPENFSDYYEMTSEIYISRDAFGDFHFVNIKFCLTLKDNFQFIKCSAYNSVAIEIITKGYYRDFSVDLENSCLVWGNSSQELNSAPSTILTFDEKADLSSISYHNIEGETYYVESYEISRLLGTIYIVHLD